MKTAAKLPDHWFNPHQIRWNCHMYPYLPKKNHGRITIFITIGSSFIFPIPWKFPSAAPTFLRPRDEFLADLPARSRVHRRHGG